MGRWVTNLESVEHLTQEFEQAQAAFKNNKDDPQAKAMFETAKFKLNDVKRTLNKIMSEHPGATIGQPMATEWRTQEQIAAQGVVGIYKPGAGTEPQAKEPVAVSV